MRGALVYTTARADYAKAQSNRGTSGNIMAGETKALAQFAAGLRYEDIPAPAVAIAKACIVDTVGVVLFGSTMPWSRIVDDYVQHIGDRPLDHARLRLSPHQRAGRGLCQRRLRARLRVRQSAPAVDRRASRRHRADRCFSCGRRSQGVRQGFDHRLRRRPGMHVPLRACGKKLERKARLSCAGNHRRVRIGGRGQQGHEADGRSRRRWRWASAARSAQGFWRS